MKIIRNPLAEEQGPPTVIAGYGYINLYTGNCFIDKAAQEEYDSRAGTKCIEVVNEYDPLDPERIRHTATIIGSDGVRLVEFFGIWPDNDGKYKLPPGTVDDSDDSPDIDFDEDDEDEEKSAAAESRIWDKMWDGDNMKK